MNNRTYEFNYDETVTSAGTVAGRIVSYDIVFSDPVPTDNASLITSGTLPDARLSSNVPLKNTVNIFTQNQTINGDVEVTDSTKGIILKSGNNTRWRITITDSGTLQRVALSILAITMLAVSSVAQTVTDVVVGTNGTLAAPTNFFTANLPNWATSTNPAQARTNLGLGSAATNDGSAFQPASSSLTNLASNNGSGLTNIPISGVVNLQTNLNSKLATNGSANGLTNFPTLNQNTTGTASNVTGVVALTNGGTGTNSVGGARTNLGLGATNNVTFSNITATGTLAVTGDTALSGVNNTMPGATNAASASSLMTRGLSDARFSPMPMTPQIIPWFYNGSLNVVRVTNGSATLGTLAAYPSIVVSTNAGDSGAMIMTADVWGAVDSAANPWNAVGKSVIIQGRLASTQSNAISRYVWSSSTNWPTLMTNLGTNGISNLGWAVETRTSGGSNEARLIVNGSTNISESAWTVIGYSPGNDSSFMVVPRVGSTSLYWAASGEPFSRTPLITVTNQIGGSAAAAFTGGLGFSVVNTNTPAGASSGYIRRCYQVLGMTNYGY